MMDTNPHSILFLFEGETEHEFYKIFFEKLPQRKIRISFSNLKGVYGLNHKVSSKIKGYLQNENYIDRNQIHVFIAYDREGDRNVSPMLDIESLIEEFVKPGSTRIFSIQEIIATQDLESWLFLDLNGIYEFIGVRPRKRNLKAYPNIEATNNRILSDLFHRNKKHYQKGKRVEGFLRSLDIDLIISEVQELEKAKSEILSLMK